MLLACAFPCQSVSALDLPEAGELLRAAARAEWLVVPDATAVATVAGAPADREFEVVIVALIDELQAKDPALFERIHAEADRIRALPTKDQREAAMRAGYPRLERALTASVASGRYSPEALAKWVSLRDQAQKALAEGTLFERAEFAGRAFDAKVQALLRRGKTVLDPGRRLPERKAEYLELSKRIHAAIGVPGNSTALTPGQLDKAFALAGAQFGIRPEFLKYMAKAESGLRQVVPSNPSAVGIMQIEKVHKDAYEGSTNVANDTVTNIVYGGLLRAQTDRAMARHFAAARLAPPSDSRVVEFLGDLAYNRGPGLLKFVAANAASQGIDVDRFADYIAGRGGSYALLDGGRRIVILPGPGTGVDRTGKGSVLEQASEAVGRVRFSKTLAQGLGDRNGDGRVDHLDVWLTRGMRYLHDPDL